MCLSAAPRAPEAGADGGSVQAPALLALPCLPHLKSPTSPPSHSTSWVTRVLVSRLLLGELSSKHSIAHVTLTATPERGRCDHPHLAEKKAEPKPREAQPFGGGHTGSAKPGSPSPCVNACPGTWLACASDSGLRAARGSPEPPPWLLSAAAAAGLGSGPGLSSGPPS